MYIRFVISTGAIVGLVSDNNYVEMQTHLLYGLEQCFSTIRSICSPGIMCIYVPVPIVTRAEAIVGVGDESQIAQRPLGWYGHLHILNIAGQFYGQTMITSCTCETTRIHVTVLGVLCCFFLVVCLTLLASFFLPSHLSLKHVRS